MLIQALILKIQNHSKFQLAFELPHNLFRSLSLKEEEKKEILYRKSFIKPPGSYLISDTPEGGLKEGGAY